MVRRKHIRTLTEDLLTEHDITEAAVDVEAIAAALGIRIQKQKASEDMSGFLFRNHQESTVVIGVNSHQSETRQRFTVAHEIGHFLLHADDRMHVDRGYEVKLRDAKSSEGTDVEEKEANLFAAELLMPEKFLERDLAELDGVDLCDEQALKGIAEKYQVSTQALAFRLAYLGYS